MTKTSEKLVGGGFAYLTAPFASHHNDQARAIEYLQALIAEQKTWKDAEAQIRAYLSDKGVAANAIDTEVARARPLLEPWLNS